jgi:signal transduction histidine kinase
VHVLFWGGMVPVMLAVYTVARHGAARHALLAVGATAALLLVLDLFVVGPHDPNDFAFRWINAVLAFALGRVLHRTEARARDSALRARAAEEATALALDQERARIAREMHDVVAHSVSVMVVQAGAAEQVLDDDPEFARAALGRIRATGREALGEMRRVLEVLRDQADAGALTPQPGLAGVAELVDHAVADGLRADLVVEGAPRPLPPGLDLAAYRIVQEALTNVRRHAEAAAATVYLRYGAQDVEVEVVDDGRGVPLAVPPEPGHGLLGMRERVALYGGRLEAGAGDVGFRVRAVLPLGAG